LQERWEAADPEAARAADQSFFGKGALGFAAAAAFLTALLNLEVETAPAWWAGAGVVLLALLAWSFREPRLACGVGIFVYLVSWLAPLFIFPGFVIGSPVVMVFTVLALAGGFAAETRMTRRRARMIAARAARLRPRSPTS